MRYQFMSMRPRLYIDIQVVSLMCHILNTEKKERFEKLMYCVPPKILLFASVLYSEHWLMYVLDVTQREFFVLNSKNIVSPTDERTALNKFALMLEEFRKKIMINIILSKENAMRAEAIKGVHEMRIIRPGAALRSPYVQISTLDLPSK
ncbi:hypothetical protein PIB30_016840 [Stylosanthes scabra]|uniref:Ubiquitin-like protease family profile domain-containing protein n=1 Tax=Stylosanthes scabra TaxID=79078 RepID=A0ABU6T955_9FABA|nr:hypothetical protein [Stylosanthes scabra]